MPKTDSITQLVDSQSMISAIEESSEYKALTITNKLLIGQLQVALHKSRTSNTPLTEASEDLKNIRVALKKNDQQAASLYEVIERFYPVCVEKNLFTKPTCIIDEGKNEANPADSNLSQNQGRQQRTHTMTAEIENTIRISNPLIKWMPWAKRINASLDNFKNGVSSNDDLTRDIEGAKRNPLGRFINFISSLFSNKKDMLTNKKMGILDIAKECVFENKTKDILSSTQPITHIFTIKDQPLVSNPPPSLEANTPEIEQKNFRLKR